MPDSGGTAMTETQWLEIQPLANVCLIECLTSETPLSTLQDFIASLEYNGWEKSAIMDVEDMILSSLEIMKHTESEAVVHQSHERCLVLFLLPSQSYLAARP
jgi:hypothetical protein